MSMIARVLFGVGIALWAAYNGYLAVTTYQRTGEIDWGFVLCVGLLLIVLWAVVTGRAEVEEEEKAYEQCIKSPPPSSLWERITTFAASRAATRSLAYLILILFIGYMIYAGYMHRHYNFVPSRDPARYMNAVFTFCIAALFVIYFLPARRQ